MVRNQGLKTEIVSSAKTVSCSVQVTKLCLKTTSAKTVSWNVLVTKRCLKTSSAKKVSLNVLEANFLQCKVKICLNQISQYQKPLLRQRQSKLTKEIIVLNYGKSIAAVMNHQKRMPIDYEHHRNRIAHGSCEWCVIFLSTL